MQFPKFSSRTMVLLVAAQIKIFFFRLSQLLLSFQNQMNLYGDYLEKMALKNGDEALQPFKSADSMFLNSGIFRNYLKNGFGQSLHINSQKLGTYDYDNFEQQNVQQEISKFMHNFDDYGKRIQLLKRGIRDQMEQAKNETQQMTLQQLSFQFPWLLSNTVMFQPFRSMLFCIHNNIPAQQAPNLQQIMSNSALNLAVNQILFDSIKNNQPTIAITLNALKNSSKGFFASSFYKWLTNKDNRWFLGQAFLGAIISVVSSIYQVPYLWSTVSVIGGIKALINIANFISSKIKWPDILKRKQKKSQLDKMVQEMIGSQKIKSLDAIQPDQLLVGLQVLATHIFRQIRPYGQLLLNFDFIKKKGILRNINSQQFYNFVETPDLFFTLRNSTAYVYRYYNGNMIPIQQSEFKIKFLRDLIKLKAASMTGRMIRQINYRMGASQDQLQAREQFIKNNVPSASSAKLKKYLQMGNSVLQNVQSRKKKEKK